MEIGIIGLGRMGANIGRRLVAGGHRVVGLDPGPGVEALIKGAGIEYARSLTDLVASLSPPRVIWLMIPAGAAVQATLDEIAPLLVAGDTLIDGGNSYYKDSMRRGAELTAKKLCFVDCGTSGGIWGLKEGFGLMIGAGYPSRMPGSFSTPKNGAVLELEPCRCASRLNIGRS